jgi:hypothetical protein
MIVSMLTLKESIQCAPVASAGFALSMGAFIARVVEVLPAPDFLPANGVNGVLFGGAMACISRMAGSTLAGDGIRSRGLPPSEIDSRREKRIANIVIGDGAYQLRTGYWKPRVWTDNRGITIVKGSVVDDDDCGH